MKRECWGCLFKQQLPDSAFISCANPDPAMTGDDYGMRKGWFSYPRSFDPLWKTRKCANYVSTENSTASDSLEATIKKGE